MESFKVGSPGLNQNLGKNPQNLTRFIDNEKPEKRGSGEIVRN